MIFTLSFFVISIFCLSAYDIKIFKLQRDAFRCISATQICWSNFSFFIFDPPRFKKRLCFQWKQTEKQLHPLCSANICIPCPYFPSRYTIQDVVQRSEYSHESVNRIYGLRGRQLQWHFLVEFISFEALEMSLPLKITVWKVQKAVYMTIWLSLARMEKRNFPRFSLSTEKTNF